ncbi:hypothetical protein FRACA_1180010 [Frankia canadensis]|uniref:Uncharacterized protein n=1 Tax=Frankia canadensis TaxID=1836972 RepID=A0A2I2KJR2_9ACTN|nr:hypothetical protein [Frankia canadensis]SNQ45912.1 hypothetical protein FRACA_1180010 [Frankia canadensis]SOU53202.1 hypothetical protein FRACA_1180010 [Frankia canadensis]
MRRRWLFTDQHGHAHLRGTDGPRRLAATREEALLALDHFITHRLAAFGPYEDAMLAGDWTMAHSLLSPALNLGLLHPSEVAAAEGAYRRGDAQIVSAEGFVRQVLGWREYVWGICWWRARTTLTATRCTPPPHCRAGSPTSTRTRSRPPACPTCSPGCGTAPGYTTFPG